MVSPGAPHGITDTHREQLNADLLPFVQRAQSKARRTRDVGHDRVDGGSVDGDSPSHTCDTERVYTSELTLHDDARRSRMSFTKITTAGAGTIWVRKSPGRWPSAAST